MFAIIGWLLGASLGLALGLSTLLSLGFAIPGVLGTIAGFLPAAVGTLPAWPAIALIVAIYLIGYIIATRSLAPSLPATPSLPTTPTPLPALPGESFARGWLIGATASLNAAALVLISPLTGALLAPWAFVLISLATIPAISLNRVYQGFLGWSAWLFPISYFATAVGFLLFVINFIPALAAGGIAAFRLDFTTGVIETSGGLSGITGFSGGFSLGNFNFITSIPIRGPFMAPSLSSHETGHSLNTACMGGIVLWINAVDENLPPFRRLNLAYGELLAESHRMGMPGTVPSQFFVRIWG